VVFRSDEGDEVAARWWLQFGVDVRWNVQAGGGC